MIVMETILRTSKYEFWILFKYTIIMHEGKEVVFPFENWTF